MTGHASWPAKAIGHKHCLIVSERIAHPFKCCLSPTSRTKYYLGFSGYPLRIEAGLTLQLNTSVNGGSRIFTGNKHWQ
jgi:hypothetical protein